MIQFSGLCVFRAQVLLYGRGFRVNRPRVSEFFKSCAEDMACILVKCHLCDRRERKWIQK